MSMSTTTDLTVYERIKDPLAAVKELGKAIAKSKMFGCENIEQGEVFALECLSRKCPPLSLAEDYHVIEGKLSMRADAMLARFLESGGRHRVVQRNADGAVIELKVGRETEQFSYSWEEAQAAGAHLTKGGKPLPTWSTPRGRMQMLWARVISDGVRTMAPQVCRGKYTPEDLGYADPREAATVAGQDEIEAEYEVKVVDGDSTPCDAASVQPEPTTAVDAATATVAPGGTTEQEHIDSGADSGGEIPMCNQQQRDRLNWLCMELDEGANDGRFHKSVKAALVKDGVSSMLSWTFQRASEVIVKLEQRYYQREQERKQQAVQQPAEDPATSEHDDDRISKAIEADLRQRLVEYEQVKAGVCGLVKSWLDSIGKQRLAELTVKEARALRQALEGKQIDDFFADVLAKGRQVAEAVEQRGK